MRKFKYFKVFVLLGYTDYLNILQKIKVYIHWYGQKFEQDKKFPNHQKKKQYKEENQINSTERKLDPLNRKQGKK